jgi:hypothetical protein
MAKSYEVQQPLAAGLQTWQQQRTSLAEALAGLKLEDWKRTGRHQIQGERTLLWWLEYAVNHVSNHRQQLADILESGASASS